MHDTSATTAFWSAIAAKYDHAVDLQIGRRE